MLNFDKVWNIKNIAITPYSALASSKLVRDCLQTDKRLEESYVTHGLVGIMGRK